MLFSYNKKTKQELTFRKNPDFYTSNFESFRPFPAKGGSYGAIFMLDRVSKKRLSYFTTQNQGSYLLSLVNGKPSEPVLIDRTVNDGVLVVWSGMTVRDIRSLEIEMPRTGQDLDEWKKQAKESKKALRNIIVAEKQKKKGN